MSRVPLPGLAAVDDSVFNTSSSNTEEFIKVPKMSTVPKGKNPFERVGVWNGEIYDNLQIVVGAIDETTSAARRTQGRDQGNPNTHSNTRHWRSNISFKCNGYDSRVIKNFGVGVPKVKSREYGNNYCYASLQKAIADKIIKACADKNIRVTHVEQNVHGSDDEWWATVNNMAGRTGFIKAKQFVEKPLSTVFNNTNGGVTANVDFLVSLKLKKDDNTDRSENDVYSLAVECSRFVISNLNQNIPVPDIKSQTPTIALAKDDVIDDELANALDEMM